MLDFFVGKLMVNLSYYIVHYRDYLIINGGLFIFYFLLELFFGVQSVLSCKKLRHILVTKF